MVLEIIIINNSNNNSSSSSVGLQGSHPLQACASLSFFLIEDGMQTGNEIKAATETK